MKPSLKRTRSSRLPGEAGTVSITFGSVTVEVTPPPEAVKKTNIKKGQAALKRARHALLKPGVKLPREKGVPLYFGCEDKPGLMIQELDGKRTVGKFVDGRFCTV